MSMSTIVTKYPVEWIPEEHVLYWMAETFKRDAFPTVAFGDGLVKWPWWRWHLGRAVGEFLQHVSDRRAEHPGHEFGGVIVPMRRPLPTLKGDGPNEHTMGFLPGDNCCDDPTRGFAMSTGAISDLRDEFYTVLAFCHSHPRDHIPQPSLRDVQQQRLMGMPWLIGSHLGTVRWLAEGLVEPQLPQLHHLLPPPL